MVALPLDDAVEGDVGSGRRLAGPRLGHFFGAHGIEAVSRVQMNRLKEVARAILDNSGSQIGCNASQRDQIVKNRTASFSFPKEA